MFNPHEQEKEQPKMSENFGLGLVGKNFKEICDIPHGSSNEQQIGDYIEKKSQENDYEFIRDEAGNIVVILPGNPNKESTILQTHMDMVKEPDTLTIVVPELKTINGETWITSKNEETTLGADNGIMLASQLSLMEELKTIDHGDIAMLFTTQEETGMFGAKNLGNEIKSKLSKYKNLINLDNEDDNELIISSAGMGISTLFLQTKKEVVPKSKKLYKISISGLPGGHSGVEIDKGIPNANKEIGKKLHGILAQGYKINLVSAGGESQAINKIATNCQVIIATDQDIKTNYPDFEEIQIENPTMFNSEITSNFVNLLNQLPSGVIKRNIDLSPKSSTNLGIVETTENGIEITLLTRSSSDNSIIEIRKNIADIADTYYFSVNEDPLTSGWEADTNNKLVDYFKSKNFVLKSIHAGLECGVLSKHLPDSYVISIGPTIENAHTVRERVRVKSVINLHNILLNMLSL